MLSIVENLFKRIINLPEIVCLQKIVLVSIPCCTDTTKWAPNSKCDGIEAIHPKIKQSSSFYATKMYLLHFYLRFNWSFVPVHSFVHFSLKIIDNINIFYWLMESGIAQKDSRRNFLGRFTKKFILKALSKFCYRCSSHALIPFELFGLTTISFKHVLIKLY